MIATASTEEGKTAEMKAKKLEALDEMFVAQTSRVRLLEQLKRHRRVVAANENLDMTTLHTYLQQEFRAPPQIIICQT